MGGNKIKKKLFKIYAICSKNNNGKTIVPWKEFLNPQAAVQCVWKLPPKRILEVYTHTHTHTHSEILLEVRTGLVGAEPIIEIGMDF